MIIRFFRAKILPGYLELWQDKVEKFSIPWLTSQWGLVDFFPGRPVTETAREFSMTSIWESMDALVDAVGEDWQQVVLLEDEATLVEEASVEHYEIFGSQPIASNHK